MESETWAADLILARETNFGDELPIVIAKIRAYDE
jgi:hypothetical protein